MKIACIGNMNNSFFSLVRYLRDKGMDAQLFLLKDYEYIHFHPSADAYDLDYQSFTHELSWGNPFDFIRFSKKEIAESIKDFYFIIGCGLTPAFLNKAGRDLDIFIPHGADLYNFPFLKIVNPKHQLDYCASSYNQRIGIRRSRFINMDISYPVLKEQLNRIRPFGKIINSYPPALYMPLYNPEDIFKHYESSQWFKEFKKIRDTFEIVIFHHARLIWKNNHDNYSLKGNHKLVQGFAEFVKKHPQGNKSCLVMCEYGVDVFETKKLVSFLGIEKNVKWFPIMPRKEIMIGINLCDIGTGDFESGYLLGGVNYEVLTMGKPFMHYRNDALYKDYYCELYPIINVNTANEIFKALSDYAAHPEYYKEMGKKGRAWLQKNAIEYPLNKYIEIINNS